MPPSASLPCTRLAAGNLDPTFQTFSPMVGVAAVATDADNRVLAGVWHGDGIVRLLADGRVDESFDKGALRSFLRKPVLTVVAFCIQSDGKILVGAGSGDSEYWLGNYVMRLHTNGTVDESFHCAINTSNTLPYAIRALALQPDGKILVGGRAPGRTPGTVPHGIIRFLTNGAIDPAFDPGKGTELESPAESGTVTSILPQADGQIIIAGGFLSFNGTNRSGIARLHSNGSLDLSFVPDPRVTVNSLAQLQPDGKIIAAGRGSDPEGMTRVGVLRLNQDGSLDPSLDTSVPEGINVLSLASDGRIVIAGWFSTVNGVQRLGVARLNSNGSLDTAFDTDTRWFADAGVLDSLGRFVVGGRSYLTGTAVARLNGDVPTKLETPIWLGGSSALIRLRGNQGATYGLQVSSNLLQWLSIQTNIAANCVIEFVDPNAAFHSQRFYRAIQLTP